jgi:carbon storage regulator
MLVLSRKPQEAIVINGNVRITIVEVKGDRVRLGIEAPRSVSVDRGEVHARKVTYVDVPVAAGFCDATVDLGGVLVATAEGTAY